MSGREKRGNRLLIKEKEYFISRMGPCEDLLVNPNYPQHIIDSGIVFSFGVMSTQFPVIKDFPIAVSFVLSLDTEHLDYQVCIRGYLEPEKLSVKNTADTTCRYTSFWDKAEHKHKWTQRETIKCMLYNIFKQFNRNYYYGDYSFVSFPSEMLMILEKRFDGKDYALEALFYSNDLTSIVKDGAWHKQTEKYFLDL